MFERKIQISTSFSFSKKFAIFNTYFTPGKNDGMVTLACELIYKMLAYDIKLF